MIKGSNKKGMEMELIGWWIIGIVVLVIMVSGYLILKGKGMNALEFLKDLIRFGR